MYKIRFHLGKGVNFQKWQIKSPNGDVSFHEPSEVAIFMEGCSLHNNPTMAQKIFGGDTKDVCAWVNAKDVVVGIAPIKKIMSTSRVLHFNPKVLPYWNLDKENIDKAKFDRLFTCQRHIILGK